MRELDYGSLEPRVLTDEFVLRLSKIKKLCPHFHLSVQSLDDNVLRQMNRKYTKDYILDRVQFIRKYIKDVAFTCDIIVGFPGESDKEFENTLNAANIINFYDMHVFKYSKRKWTKAASMETQIDGATKHKRSEKLIQLAKKNKLEFMEKRLGKIYEVLLESYEDGYLYGYTSNYIRIKVKGDKSLCKSVQNVELCKIEGDLILGKLLI